MKKLTSILAVIVIILTASVVFPACRHTDEIIGDYYIYAVSNGNNRYSMNDSPLKQVLSLKENGKMSVKSFEYNDNNGNYDPVQFDGIYRLGEKGFLGNVKAQKIIFNCDGFGDYIDSEYEAVYADGALYLETGMTYCVAVKEGVTGILPFHFTSSNQSQYVYENGITYRFFDQSYSVIKGEQYLTSVEIPSEIDGYPVVSIDDDAFYGCVELTDIIIPDGVMSIGDRAFAYCQQLKNVTISDSVTNIGAAAFAYCGNLESIVLPENVEIIRYETFYYCYALKNVDLPKNLRCIEGCAFWKCINLQQIILPSGLEKIKNSAFSYAFAVNWLIIPKSVTEIVSFAFYDSAISRFYCEFESKPEGWAQDWVVFHPAVYWGGEWEYADGVPVKK